jgi:hypothetical protein
MNREDIRIAFGNALGKFTKEVIATNFSPEQKAQMFRIGLRFLTYIFEELGISKADMVYKIRSLDDYD